jgi:hypothetical protein
MQLTLAEYKLLLEAFTNWMDTDHNQWTDKGKATSPEYQTIIDKLQAMITQREG